MDKYKRDLILGIVFFFGSVLFLIESFNIPYGFLDRAAGFLASPKGFTQIIIIPIMFLSIILIIKSVIHIVIKKEKNIVKETIMSKELLIILFSLIIYLLTLPIMGFNVNSFFLLMIAIIAISIKEKSISLNNSKEIKHVFLKAFVITVGTLIILNIVFVNLLNVYLPIGIFGI